MIILDLKFGVSLIIQVKIPTFMGYFFLRQPLLSWKILRVVLYIIRVFFANMLTQFCFFSIVYSLLFFLGGLIIESVMNQDQ